MKQGNKGMHMLAFALVIIGALNWLLVGIFGWDVGEIFGGMDAVVSRIIYVVVGLAVLYMLVAHKYDRKTSTGAGNMTTA